VASSKENLGFPRLDGRAQALHASGLLSDKHFKFGNLYPHRIYYPGKLDFQIWQQWKE
jgi:hypothetical protein